MRNLCLPEIKGKAHSDIIGTKANSYSSLQRATKNNFVSLPTMFKYVFRQTQSLVPFLILDSSKVHSWLQSL